MGADVNHPAPGDSLRPSFCSVIASMDSRACRYSASLRAQGPRVEIISDLEAMTVELFKVSLIQPSKQAFYQQSKAKPERVLFFRDGVSEGQFAHVVEAEIKAIRSACETLEKGYRPNITFIVVAKRHHARFFPVDRRDADRTGNCPAGTVVDTDIVHPQFYDFYLLSHPGLQGTSRPTHYSILVDENKLSVDDIQALSYNLCHVYARCTRVVSIVPPVYYAHLVGRRARFHTKMGASGEPTEDSASSIGNTGNTMGTEEAVAAENAMVASYAPVRPSLQKSMSFLLSC
jgi:eukaryotic translation initiation factor 2C